MYVALSCSDPDLFVYCCDFSSNAVNLVKVGYAFTLLQNLMNINWCKGMGRCQMDNPLDLGEWIRNPKLPLLNFEWQDSGDVKTLG